MTENLVFSFLLLAVGILVGAVFSYSWYRDVKEPDWRAKHREELAHEINQFFAHQADGCLRPIWPEELLAIANRGNEKEENT